MAIFDFATEYAMFPRGGLVLCAVSGGADSMYLLSNLLEYQDYTGCRVVAAHFDHCLRGEESRRDARFVQDWCTGRGVTCVLGSGDVAAQAKAEGRGVEETARALRYEFLHRTAEKLGADVIATAHTADDNAETMLMNLVRGSGLEGLSGIPPRRGNIVRPMLTTTREEVEAWLAEHDVPHVEDGSNCDEAYTRNFLRRQVMPLMKRINFRAVEHMSAAAARLRRDNDVLNAQGARLAGAAHQAEDGWVIPVKAFDLIPDPVALRAVRQLVVRCGGKSISAVHLNAVVGIIRGEDPSAMLHLPKVMVRRVYGDVLFTPWREGDGPMVEQEVAPEGVVVWGEWTVACTTEFCPQEAEHTPREFWLARERLAGPLVIRPRREGDAIRPVGRPSKTVKKWLIDEKVPRLERETLPVVWDGVQVAAVGGLGGEETLLAKTGERAFHIIMERTENTEGEGMYAH